MNNSSSKRKKKHENRCETLDVIKMIVGQCMGKKRRDEGQRSEMHTSGGTIATLSNVQRGKPARGRGRGKAKTPRTKKMRRTKLNIIVENDLRSRRRT